MNSTIEAVPGLDYVENYLSREDQEDLLAVIDQQIWLSDLKRRVQHYGYRYDYTRRIVDDSLYLGPLPDWAARLAQQLTKDGWSQRIPDQLIVNEYVPGQGISSHVDCIPCFGDRVFSLTLGSPCLMLFSHVTTNEQIPIILEPGSLVVMQGEARYKWKHGIPARKTDVLGERRIERTRRVSLTFRTVIWSPS